MFDAKAPSQTMRKSRTASAARAVPGVKGMSPSLRPSPVSSTSGAGGRRFLVSRRPNLPSVRAGSRPALPGHEGAAPAVRRPVVETPAGELAEELDVVGEPGHQRAPVLGLELGPDAGLR